METKYCQICSNPIAYNSDKGKKAYEKRKYCSSACSLSKPARKQPTPRPELLKPCDICGETIPKEENRNWNEYAKKRFCSRKCMGVAKSLKVDLVCDMCGTSFVRPPSQSVRGKHGGIFCSSECHYASRSTGITPRVVNRPYVISNDAYDGWRAGAQKTVAKRRIGDNYIRSDETKEKASIATARFISRTQGKAGSSSELENRVANQLDEMGIAYERQCPFRDINGRFAFVVDFMLSDGTTIEVNGTYWHCDPRAYPAPINEMQERCIAKYRRKLESLWAQGITVIELWEIDLRKDMAGTIQRAFGL